MFPSMFLRRPDKEVALKQLRTNIIIFGAYAVAVRITPYILHYFSDDGELKLEL